MLFSCSEKREIKSIEINDEIFYPKYLCSFENADIDYDYIILNDIGISKPTSSGYTLISDKTNKKVQVWNSFYFERENNLTFITENDNKTFADIIEIIEEYAIEIKEKKDTYIITYYTFSVSSATDIDKNRLIDSVEKHMIETVKENVIITYYE